MLNNQNFISNMEDDNEDKEIASQIDQDVIHRIECNDMTLTAIKLPDDFLPERQYVDGEDIIPLITALTGNIAVTSLDLSDNDLGDEGASLLKELLQQNKKLKILDLSRNRILTTGGKALADGLVENAALLNLNLLENSLGDEGARAFARVFATNRTLTHISLADNGISTAGAEAIASSLKHNRSLTHVNFAYNDFGNDGIEVMVEAWNNHCNIINACFADNNIEDAGAAFIAGLLTRNPKLTSLDLSANDITDIGGQLIYNALLTNTAITGLSLQGNKIKPSLLKKINTKVDNNKATAEMLLTAVEQENLADVQQLIAEGASLNYQNQDGNTALHIAATTKNASIIEYLLEQPAQVILRNNNGELPDCKPEAPCFNWNNPYRFFTENPPNYFNRRKNCHRENAENYAGDITICNQR